MIRPLTITIMLALQTIPLFAQPTHLDIMVPDRRDTDLVGPVKCVETKTSANVSGKFERERQEYDRVGNLLIETEWNADDKLINTLTNFYDDNGVFQNQIFINIEESYTNEWKVILNPETRQLAKKKKNGAAAIFTYSPEGYLVNYRHTSKDRKLRSASITKRREDNRTEQYTKLDRNMKPVYTYWFKWKENGFIDRERQSYQKEDSERLHIYDYLKTDEQGNWTQRLMARYDIGGKEKKLVHERTVVRHIEYFEDEPVETELSEPTDLAPETGTNTTTLADVDIPKPESTNTVPEVATNTVEVVSTEKETSEELTEEEEKEKRQGELKAHFEYSFDDISDKLVIITCRSAAGRSAGSGFVAKMDGRTYLFTNQHVIMGADTIRFKTAAGELLEPRGVELSKTRDIARIPIEDRDAFEISEKFAYGIPMGVFGNSEGAGVATELYGEVTGLGVDLVEVTAEFVSGNSGSPVLDKSQKVIGIASYVRVTWTPPSDDEKKTSEDDEEDQAEDAAEEGKFKPKTRRFCYRLTDLEWQPVNWKTYNNKYGKLYRTGEDMTSDVFSIIGIWSKYPLEKIPANEDMAHDIRTWVKKHNDIIDRYQRRQFNRSSFLNAYSGSLEILSDTCFSRSRRIRMFSTQRELTGFLETAFKKNAQSLEYAGNYIQSISDNI